MPASTSTRLHGSTSARVAPALRHVRAGGSAGGETSAAGDEDDGGTAEQARELRGHGTGYRPSGLGSGQSSHVTRARGLGSARTRLAPVGA